MRKMAFFSLILLLAACKNTSVRSEAGRNLSESADTEQESEIFYLSSLKLPDGSYHSLYYDPVFETYLSGTMESAKEIPAGLKDHQPLNELAYLTKLPIKHEDYTYLGALDPLTRVYSNQRGVFLLKFKLFGPQVQISNPETGRTVLSKVYPVLDDRSPLGYLFTEFQSAYLFDTTFNNIFYDKGLSQEEELNLRTNWRAYVHIPLPLTNGRPALADLARNIEEEVPPLH